MSTVRTRVLLFDLDRMVREIIESAIASQPDFVLVDATAYSSLLEALDVTGADAAISGPADPELLAPLFERWPRLKLLTVIAAGRELLLYQLLPHRESLGELSPIGLVDTLRRAREHQGRWSSEIA